jgi:hypothetical protein
MRDACLQVLEACCCLKSSIKHSSSDSSPSTINLAKPFITTTTMSHTAPQCSSSAAHAQFPSENFVQGGGVAIFHLKSERVVICSEEDRHGKTYYFLPKGRRDAGEDSARGAEREGFEEVYHHVIRIFPIVVSNANSDIKVRISQPSPSTVYIAPPTTSASPCRCPSSHRRAHLARTHARRR